MTLWSDLNHWYQNPSFEIKLFEANAAHTYIVSNGFRDFIVPVVETLGIRPEHVFGNDFIFDEQGRIIDFSRDNVLSSNGGK